MGSPVMSGAILHGYIRIWVFLTSRLISHLAVERGVYLSLQGLSHESFTRVGWRWCHARLTGTT